MADGASLSGMLGHLALTTPAGKVATGAAVTSALREYEKEMFSRSTKYVNASRQVQCPRIALPACTRVLKVLVERASAGRVECHGGSLRWWEWRCVAVHVLNRYL